MGTREVRKKETIHRILDAAVREFAESGYEGARMDRIADRADVNKAMIYYHIGDKKALYTGVLHEVFGTMTARMSDNINRAETPSEKIQAYLQSIGKTVEAHPHLFHIMMRELASGGRRLPAIVAGDMASIIGQVGTIIKQGHQQGEFLDIDPLMLHLMVIGGIAFYNASRPVRRKHSELMEKISSKKVNENKFDLLANIETIVLSALKGC